MFIYHKNRAQENRAGYLTVPLAYIMTKREINEL